jgi:hypothetical protein
MRGKEIELRVGRRRVDGTVRLSAYQPELLQLSVNYKGEYKGERSSSVVLTRAQVQALRQELAEYELARATDEGQSEEWDHQERRLG